ncbi:MerR family transcriptional regulator [Methylobacterium nonmethylotrophicum]|uniref:MerR family transcriptional regulator n=1 Tax=Methylobacterium nonmethylotrophicum TaxID=1141884 RepID=A0A4Z0NN10_9HYPH|nr:MerR family transcriptional regulator [Methylobacterium nonmethylotrophicum]TGD98007.1 MerR family transcriptional regulator [Methylobacterium nonmethylotrophicum]
MKIGELARQSGLSVHTIRYYEKIGLLPYASRDLSSQRDYDASILSWIAFLRRLKTTGMPIRDMLRYAALRERGSGTEAERRALLKAHRDRVRAQVTELQASLLALDAKIAGYAAPQETSQQTCQERIDDAAHSGRGREPARARQARAR